MTAVEEPAHRHWSGRVLGALDATFGGLAAAALAAMVAVVFANVVGRYVFSASFAWTAEVAQWLFIAIIFLGVPLAHRSRRHVAVDLLAAHLPAAMRPARTFLVDAVVAYTTIALMLGGVELMLVIGGVSPALQLPKWLQYLVIPLSCIAALFTLALRGLDEDASPLRAPLAILAGSLAYLVLDFASLVPFAGASPALVMAVAFIVTLLLGVPVAFAMLFGAFLANLTGDLLPAPAVVQNMVRGAGQFLLLAIPFFLLTGALMNAGGLTRRLIGLAFALVGHLRGGLAQVGVVTSLLYGGISGSSYSEAAIGTKLLVPQMTRAGYPPAFGCAVVASAAILPNVIPPSIALLLVAAVANLSVGKLFVAGIVPGLVLAATLMLAIRALAVRRGLGAPAPRAGGVERLRALGQAFPVLLLALLVVGGIRFGVVTPTEAGVLAAVAAGALGSLVYRACDARGLWQALRDSAIEAALVGLLIGVAVPFAFVLIAEQVPQAVVAAVAGLADSKWAALLLANLVMLAFGMVLDIAAAILILTPLFLPLMIALGVDPIHFGLIVVVNLMIGGLTPPVGMLAYVTGSIAGTPVTAIYRAVLPLLGALLLALALIVAVPALSLGLGWLLD